MKPLTPTVTGRAVTSSWKVTAGCVTQGRRTLCRLTKHGEFWTRLVYFYPSCCECDYFLLFFNDHPDYFVSLFLQYDGVRKLISRSTTFWKEFFQRLSQRNERGRSWLTLISSIGIATNLSPLRRLSNTRSAPVSVSLSPSTTNLITSYEFTRLLLFFQRWKTRRERQPSEIRPQRTRRQTKVRWGQARAGLWRRDQCLRWTVHLRNKRFRRSLSLV